MGEKRPVPRIIDPMLNAKEVVWLGSDKRNIRKVYRILETESVRVGLALFCPGEGGSVHWHENSEEFSYSIQGGGNAVPVDNQPLAHQGKGMIKWNPVGSHHGGATSSDAGVSVKIWAYCPIAELPTNDGVISKR